MTDLSTPLLIGLVLGLAFGLWVYFAPYLVARRRKHRNRSAIGCMNFFLGWVIAMIWAYTDNVEGA